MSHWLDVVTGEAGGPAAEAKSEGFELQMSVTGQARFWF